MADLQARREARRQKIIQNSQKRLNRLYDRKFEEDEEGCNAETSTKASEVGQGEEGSLQDIDNWICKTCSHTNAGRREKCYLCNSLRNDIPTTGVYEKGVGEGTKLSADCVDCMNCSETPTSNVQKETNMENVILRQRQTVKIQKTSVSEQNVAPPTSSEKLEDAKRIDSSLSPSRQFEMLRVLGCVLLSILCRMVLKTGHGLFYFQSLILPFVFLQCGLHYYKQQNLKDLELRHRNNMMVTLLVLCGVKKDVLTMYNNIMGYLTAIGEDFCLFIFTFVISGIILV